MAVRLIFAYEGRDLRLVSRQQVDMVTPPADRPEGVGAGVWAEVRDVDGQVLDRRAVPDFLRPDVEVFGPDPAPSVARAPVERPRGAFAVLLPELPGADYVALLAAPEPAGPAAAALEAQELFRVGLAGA
ncbi:MAG TPA: hypothetical protein VHG90_07045 [Acidimicrobiales bacterium]|nr:hypothetical protein [Acidimicrobiales bacterium]